jgi:hypothetical protein
MTITATYETLSASEHSTQLRKAVIASTIGTAIEWYDFFLYGTAAGLLRHFRIGNKGTSSGPYGDIATVNIAVPGWPSVSLTSTLIAYSPGGTSASGISIPPA